MQQRPDHIQGLIYATLGALALTPDGLLVRLAGTHDWTTVFWRGLFIACCIGFVQIYQSRQRLLKRLIPQNFKEWVCAALSSVGTLMFVLSIKHTTVANTLVILSTMSLFAALFSMVFLKERIAFRTWVAMAAAICGIIIVFIDDLNGDGLDGKIYGLICAFVTAGNMTLIRSERSINVPTTFAWGGFMIAICATFIAPTLIITAQSGLTLFGMGAINAVAFILLGLGAKYIPSPEVSLLMLLETILGPLWVWLVLSETPSLNALIGGAIVITTLALHSLASLKARKQT